MNPRFEVRARRGPAGCAAVYLGGIALLMAFVSVTSLTESPDISLFAFAGALGMGYFVFRVVHRLINNTVLIAIDDSSILVTQRSARPIPFAAIREARWITSRSRTYLALRLNDPDAYPPDGALASALRGADRVMMGGDVNIGLSYLDRPDPEIVEAFMRRSGLEVDGW